MGAVEESPTAHVRAADGPPAETERGTSASTTRPCADVKLDAQTPTNPVMMKVSVLGTADIGLAAKETHRDAGALESAHRLLWGRRSQLSEMTPRDQMVWMKGRLRQRSRPQWDRHFLSGLPEALSSSHRSPRFPPATSGVGSTLPPSTSQGCLAFRL